MNKILDFMKYVFYSLRNKKKVLILKVIFIYKNKKLQHMHALKCFDELLP